MIKKSLIFCWLMNFLCVAALLKPTLCGAVDMLRAEDENLLWETQAPETQTVRSVLEERIINHNDEEPSNVEEIIFISEPLKPMRAPGLGAVRLPEDINEKEDLNAKKEELDDPAIIKVNPKTPRSVQYLIGKEREAYEASKKEWFNPEFSLLNKKEEEPVNEAREALIQGYRNRINDCLDSRQEKLDMEMSMLGVGNSYDSAAYLSQTFEAIEQCYDGVGVDIVLGLYGDDDETMKDFEKKIPDFHIHSTKPGINTKYCGENCSMRSMAEWQLEKFSDYRAYLAELISNAPDEPKIKADEIDAPLIDDEILADEASDDTFLYEDKQRGLIRVRKVDAPKAQPVMMYDDEGVPFIDESEL